MAARVTVTRASVGSTRRASGTFSTRTSPAPYMTVARIFGLPLVPGGKGAESLTKTMRRSAMQITRHGIDTAPGPNDWFTGAVYVDAVATPSGSSRLSASSVHFTPGARTAWHTHPNGQTIYVTDG